jgi:hypothetical protein
VEGSKPVYDFGAFLPSGQKVHLAGQPFGFGIIAITETPARFLTGFVLRNCLNLCCSSSFNTDQISELSGILFLVSLDQLRLIDSIFFLESFFSFSKVFTRFFIKNPII